MTTKLYLNSYNLEGNSTITATGTDDKGKWVILDETLFHAQGGGQKSDIGLINDASVISVIHAEKDQVKHYIVEENLLKTGDQVHMIVDEENRMTNAKLHTAGHFISALVEESCVGIRAIGGHHWPGESRVEFEGTSDIEDLISTINKEINQKINDNLGIKIEGDPQKSRKIKIGNYTSVPCGGTHLKSTGELVGLRVTKVKSKKGRLRMSYEINE